ncbi:MAG: VTT domain-containing protein [Firmicutes bacterium]|nr:VTT domain-containing protein [Bacillota bacterium]
MKKQSARPPGVKLTKEKRRRSLTNLIGGLLLAAAAALSALLFLRNSPALLAWYDRYREYVLRLEDFVQNLPDRLTVFPLVIPLAVLLLYAIRSMVPLFPLSVMIVITEVLSPSMGFAVNILGLTLLLSIRYWWGRWRGGGQVNRLLRLQPTIRAFLENDRKSKPWLLFMFRLAPIFPVNTVSSIYGVMRFDYADYALISLLGFLPRLITYSITGNSFFDPLTVPFLVPLIIIFTLSGVSVIGVSMALVKRQRET